MHIVRLSRLDANPDFSDCLVPVWPYTYMRWCLKNTSIEHVKNKTLISVRKIKNDIEALSFMNICPTKKTQYLHFRFHANYFLLPWKIPAEIGRRSITKGSIYYLPYYVHTTFYHGRLTKYLMFNGSIYYVFVFLFADAAFLLGGADMLLVVLTK